MLSRTSFGQGVLGASLQVRRCHVARASLGLLLTSPGNGLNVVKIMPETAIKFGSYEAAKRMLANLEGHSDPKKINSYSKFTAGGLAGMIAQ
jgi:hypothetical protein